jgi:hypothetical protein
MDDNATMSSRRTGQPAAVMPDLAERLVEEARADGVELIGPGGLLGDLTKQVLEAGLEAELSDRLGVRAHLLVLPVPAWHRSNAGDVAAGRCCGAASSST